MTRDFEALEANLLDQILHRREQDPTARIWIVAPSLDGFSRTFRREVIENNIQLRVPIHLFDTEWKDEEARHVIPTLTHLRDNNLLRSRISQPYSPYPLQENTATQDGEDLPRDLERDLSQTGQRPCLRIIIGAAGAGKSWAFRALFNTLYTRFQDAKRKRAYFPRPIPLIPEFLKTSILHDTRDTTHLFQKFLNTVVARPVHQRTLDWLLINEFQMWMFDGLDEIYSGDNKFFPILQHVLTTPNSTAQILLCARESLLTTSGNFAEFLRDFPPGPDRDVRVYRLDNWDTRQKRHFAWVKFEKRFPRRGDTDTNSVKGFLSVIDSSDIFKNLSGLPYYCDILSDAFLSKSVQQITNEFDVISYALQSILDRERKKKEEGATTYLDEDKLIPNGLDDFIETLAASYYVNQFAGVDRTEAEEYAELVIREELSEEEQEQAITNLLQFPLFALGSEGALSFKHELIAEFLAGRHWMRQIGTLPVKVGENLGERIDFGSSLIAKYMAHCLSKSSNLLESVVKALRTERLPGRAFANLLQLLLLAEQQSDTITRRGITLERRDLRYIKFAALNLQCISFRFSDLSQAWFLDCDLTEALFEDATLDETTFSGLTESHLEGAKFGDLRRFVSIMHGLEGSRRIEDFSNAAQWVEKVTGRALTVVEDKENPVILQLRALFLKYVKPDGSARRDWQSRNALSRGRRYKGAPSPEKCLEEAIRFGYLQKPDDRENVRRTPGSKYEEVVEFIREWKISSDLRLLIEKLQTKI